MCDEVVVKSDLKIGSCGVREGRSSFSVNWGKRGLRTGGSLRREHLWGGSRMKGR